MSNESPAKIASMKMSGTMDAESGQVWTTANREEEASSKPVDRYRLIWAFFLLQGIGTLLPWNMFINATDYFTKGKFVNNPDLANQYLPLSSVLSQVTNLLFSLINLLLPTKGALSKRILISLTLILAIFLLSCILANVDTSTWSYGFFILTMVSVVVINSAVGIFQSSIFAMGSYFTMSHSNAIVTGTNMSGVFSSILFLICLASAPSYSFVATLYFSIAVFAVLLCIVSFPSLRYNEFYRTCMAQKNDKQVEQPPVRETIARLCKTAKMMPVHLYNIFFIFFITLTVFPSMHAGVEAIDENFIIPPTYFSPVTCFLSFNIFAVLGNTASSWFAFPSERWLWIPITLRVIFVPIFFYSNLLPSLRTFPVVINNDYGPIIAEVLLAFTSGYYSSLVMMYAPRSVKPEYSASAAMLATLFLVLGVTVGVNVSMLLMEGVVRWGPCTAAIHNNGTLLCP